MLKEKKCPKCRVVKPIVEFSKNKSKKDGYQYHCKECSAKYQANLENKKKLEVEQEKTDIPVNELKIFQNEEFGEVRIEIVNGKEMFCASDIAKSLGYKRPNDAISQHCKGTVKHRIATKQGNSTLMYGKTFKRVCQKCGKEQIQNF